MEYNGFFVLALGLVTVFVGLICLIFITKLMSLLIRAFKKEPAVSPAAAPNPSAAAQQGIPNRQQFVAAVSAAIAEHMGTEADGLRIKSIKKL